MEPVQCHDMSALLFVSGCAVTPRSMTIVMPNFLNRSSKQNMSLTLLTGMISLIQVEYISSSFFPLSSLIVDIKC